MIDLARFVPGYDAARRNHPEVGSALATLEEALAGARLPAVEDARVAVCVAQQVGGDYASWAMERAAVHAGLDGEEIFLARLGIARGVREASK